MKGLMPVKHLDLRLLFKKIFFIMEKLQTYTKVKREV